MRTWLELNRKAILNNITSLHKKIEVPIWAMVKSNAYGHGLEIFVRELEKYVIGYGAADTLEANKIRTYTKKRVAVFGVTQPEEWQELAENSIEITLATMDMVEKLKKASLPKRLLVHIKIETGLGRYGFLPKELNLLKKEVERLPITVVGVYSHFSAVEEGFIRSAKQQLEIFNWAAKVIDPKHQAMWHMAASAAALTMPESRLDAVRVGISLYGLYPTKQRFKDLVLEPVLTWKTKIVSIHKPQIGSTLGYGNTFKVVKPMIVAVLPVGYADGYDRGLSNKGFVVIDGKRCPVVGRVFMNHILIDISGVTCQIGDDVILVGRQNNQEVTVDEIAKDLGTINYEITTRLNPLLPRELA